jgi:hypothetical protein
MNVDGAFLDPRQVWRNAGYTMSRVAAKVCFDKKSGNQSRIVGRDAASREQPFAED